MTTVYIVENDDITQCLVGSKHSFQKGELFVNKNRSCRITEVIHTTSAIYLYVEFEGTIILPDTSRFNALLK